MKWRIFRHFYLSIEFLYHHCEAALTQIEAEVFISNGTKGISHIANCFDPLFNVYIFKYVDMFVLYFIIYGLMLYHNKSNNMAMS